MCLETREWFSHGYLREYVCRLSRELLDGHKRT